MNKKIIIILDIVKSKIKSPDSVCRQGTIYIEKI